MQLTSRPRRALICTGVRNVQKHTQKTKDPTAQPADPSNPYFCSGWRAVAKTSCRCPRPICKIQNGLQSMHACSRNTPALLREPLQGADQEAKKTDSKLSFDENTHTHTHTHTHEFCMFVATALRISQPSKTRSLKCIENLAGNRAPELQGRPLE